MAATAPSDLQAHAGQGKKRKIQDTDLEDPQIEPSDQADQVCLLHLMQLTQCSSRPSHIDCDQPHFIVLRSGQSSGTDAMIDMKDMQ